MSFAAGLAAGIGTGIAVGVTSGRKKAVSHIRDYLTTHDMTINDSRGKPVQLDSVLDEAVCAGKCENNGVTLAVIIAILAGVAACGAIGYYVLL